MRDLSGPRLTWRSIPLVLAAMVPGAALITPGVGLAAKFLTRKKADNRYLNVDEAFTRTEADTRFLTQAEADALFLTPTEGETQFLTQAEGEALFLSQGQIVLSQVGPWVGQNADVLASDVEVTVISNGFAGSEFEALMQLLAPRQVGGQAYGLKDVEICYRLDDGSGDKLDSTTVTDNRTGASTTLVSHDTEGTATTDTCYTVGPATPTAPQGSLMLRLTIAINSAGTDRILIRNVKTTWVPV